MAIVIPLGVLPTPTLTVATVGGILRGRDNCGGPFAHGEVGGIPRDCDDRERLLAGLAGGRRECRRAVANHCGTFPNRVAAVARRAPDHHHAEVPASSGGFL
ncbi:unnamed protein product, partial [Prorocentrum cordatum]